MTNHPVDGDTVGHRVLWNASKKMVGPSRGSKRAELYAGTACRVYRLPAPYTRTSAERLDQ